MPKHKVRIPAATHRRHARWMLEVSTDIDAEEAKVSHTSRNTAKPKKAKSASRDKSTRQSAATPPPTAKRQNGTQASKASTKRSRSATGTSPKQESKQATESSRPLPAPAPAAARPDTPTSRHDRKRVFVIAATAALLVGTLALAGLPARRDHQAGTLPPSDPHPQGMGVTVVTPEEPDASNAALAEVSAGRASETPITAVEKPPQKREAPSEPGSKKVAAPLPAPPIIAAASLVSVAVAPPEPPPTVPTLDSSEERDDASQTLVTISGCLESTVEGDRFRLTDTEGADAPKARGWRSGFLKRRPAPVTLVEPPDRLALGQYVGRRVAATGQLTNRDLHVRSLEPVGASCP